MYTVHLPLYSLYTYIERERERSFRVVGSVGIRECVLQEELQPTHSHSGCRAIICSLRIAAILALRAWLCLTLTSGWHVAVVSLALGSFFFLSSFAGFGCVGVHEF